MLTIDESANITVLNVDVVLGDGSGYMYLKQV